MKTIHALQERVVENVNTTMCGVAVTDKFATTDLWRVDCEKCRAFFVDLEHRKAKLQMALAERLREVAQRQLGAKSAAWEKVGWWVGAILAGGRGAARGAAIGATAGPALADAVGLVIASVMVSMERDPERLKMWEAIWPAISEDAERQLKEVLKKKPPQREEGGIVVEGHKNAAGD